MPYDPKQVISVALSQVGYLEKKSASGLDDKTANAGSANYTKFARDMDGLPGYYNGKKQRVAWCDVFVDWCFVKAYGAEAGRALLNQPRKSCGAGCRYSRNYFKAKKRLFDAPQPGDQIFFWPKLRINPLAVQHTGLVYKADSQYVYTVEGNASNAVRQRKYKLSDVTIAGYGRPDWGSEASQPLYTITIAGLNETQADALLKQYPGAVRA